MTSWTRREREKREKNIAEARKKKLEEKKDERVETREGKKSGLLTRTCWTR